MITLEKRVHDHCCDKAFPFLFKMGIPPSLKSNHHVIVSRVALHCSVSRDFGVSPGAKLVKKPYPGETV